MVVDDFFFFSQSGRPFLIAEVSGNHNNDFDAAKRLVYEAREAGADAVKFQTYTAQSMTLDADSPEFIIQNPSSSWFGRRLFDIFEEGSMPWEWHEPLFQYAKSIGIQPFSSPFSAEAVDLLERLEVPFYKIASAEIVDHGLIETVARTGKPMIMSTGMATIEEISEAVSIVRSINSSQQIALLKCTSSYPASARDSNLVSIKVLRDLFRCEVGFSDHTLGNGVSAAAVASGATIIEKHLCFSRSEGGVDSAFSTEPEEFGRLRKDIDDASAACGVVKLGPTQPEMAARTRRRSLYFIRNVAKGETVTTDDLVSLRPALGLQPKFLRDIVGLTVPQDIAAGTPVNWNLFK